MLRTRFHAARVKIGRDVGVHPREWTGSGRGFDHLPGVLLFEPDGAPIAERRMEPLAVVDLVDEARQ